MLVFLVQSLPWNRQRALLSSSRKSAFISRKCPSVQDEVCNWYWTSCLKSEGIEHVQKVGCRPYILKKNHHHQGHPPLECMVQAKLNILWYGGWKPVSAIFVASKKLFNIFRENVIFLAKFNGNCQFDLHLIGLEFKDFRHVSAENANFPRTVELSLVPDFREL